MPGVGAEYRGGIKVFRPVLAVFCHILGWGMKIVWTMTHKNCFFSKTLYLRASQNILKDLKILYSRAFKNIEIQNFLQPW